MKQPTIKRGAGRPAKPADEGKRHSLTFRLSGEMRIQIEKAARERGRSLAQEVESRLERSFALEQVLGPQEHAKFLRLVAASSDSYSALLRQISALKSAIEARTNGSFEDDPATFWAVRAGACDLMNRLMPEEPEWAAAHQRAAEGAVFEVDFDQREAWEHIGIEVARVICPIPRRHTGLIAPQNTE